MLRESLLLSGFVIMTNNFLAALFLIFFHWVVSFFANTVNSTLHSRWKKIVKKSFSVIWIWMFGFRVHGANISIIEATVIWEMLLLCELLLLGVLLPWITFSLIIALSNDFFGWVSSLSPNIVYSSLRHRTKSVRREKPPKFKLRSWDSASKLLTITP